MNCELEFTGRKDVERFIHRCKHCTEEVRSAYEDPAKRKRQCRNPQEPQPIPLPPPPGPGTELTAIFAELSIKPKASCQCKARASAMDSLGIAGCQAKREEILAWMKEAYDSITFTEWVTTGYKLMQLPWFNPLDPLGSILNEAMQRAEAKQHEGFAELFSAEPRDKEWRNRADVAAAQQLYLDKAVATNHVMPAGFEGRGIVTLGGSAKYFGAAYAMVSTLRKLGCTLPVEWWFLGWEEMDPKMVALAESLGEVQCVNLFERLGKYDRKPRRIGGWEAKAWAIMYSRFAEVLFLDADQIPASDPAFLFDSVEYLDKGTVAWPDFPPYGWSVTDKAFQIARLPTPGRTANPEWKSPTDYTPWETGQFLVDKARGWHALEVWAAMEDQSDFWHPSEYKGRGGWFVYGDKDLAYLAWETTKTPYAVPPACSFAGDKTAGAFMQSDFAGNVLFQHRVQPAYKWVLHGENKEVPGSVNHALCLDALDDLRTKWTGKIWDALDESELEQQAAAALVGDYVWFRHGEPTRISLWPGGKTSDPMLFWTVRDLDGARIFISTFDRRQAEFGKDSRDPWTWVNHASNNFLMVSPPADFEVPLLPSEVVIWHEVVLGNEYRLPYVMDGQTVIDVGGHCGMFATACLYRGAKKVVSVEPIPENFARLENNLRKYGGGTVLFLCSGNYYRSRYAEALFNWEAQKRGIPWRAISRGLNPALQPGPMASQAKDALTARGIPAAERNSILATDADFAAAQCIIAVKEAEHRPMLTERFPNRLGAVEFWHVDDLDCSPPEQTIAALEREVGGLLDRLAKMPVDTSSIRINAAAWGSHGQTPDTLYLEQKPGANHTGGWSAIGTTTGIECRVIRFEQVLDLHGPADLVKLDCEGSEWPILESFTKWEQVTAWCGEYHLTTADEARERLTRIFQPHGYTIEIAPHPLETHLGHFWARRKHD